VPVVSSAKEGTRGGKTPRSKTNAPMELEREVLETAEPTVKAPVSPVDPSGGSTMQFTVPPLRSTPAVFATSLPSDPLESLSLQITSLDFDEEQLISGDVLSNTMLKNKHNSCANDDITYNCIILLHHLGDCEVVLKTRSSAFRTAFKLMRREKIIDLSYFRLWLMEVTYQLCVFLGPTVVEQYTESKFRRNLVKKQDVLVDPSELMERLCGWATAPTGSIFSLISFVPVVLNQFILSVPVYDPTKECWVSTPFHNSHSKELVSVCGLKLVASINDEKQLSATQLIGTTDENRALLRKDPVLQFLVTEEFFSEGEPGRLFQHSGEHIISFQGCRYILVSVQLYRSSQRHYSINYCNKDRIWSCHDGCNNGGKPMRIDITSGDGILFGKDTQQYLAEKMRDYNVELESFKRRRRLQSREPPPLPQIPQYLLTYVIVPEDYAKLSIPNVEPPVLSTRLARIPTSFVRQQTTPIRLPGYEYGEV
jgi:hypothetical protein